MKTLISYLTVIIVLLTVSCEEKDSFELKPVPNPSTSLSIIITGNDWQEMEIEISELDTIITKDKMVDSIIVPFETIPEEIISIDISYSAKNGKNFSLIEEYNLKKGRNVLDILIKDLSRSDTNFTCGDSVTDIEGNTYGTVKIGDQCWMTENLKTRTYPDGTPIESTYDGSGTWKAWNDGTDDCYSCPPNASNDGADCGATSSLGLLYQWDAVMNDSTSEGAQGICPDGWHVPTDSEWHSLEDYLDEDTCDDTRSASYDCDPAGSKMAGNDAADENWTGGILAWHDDFDSSGLNVPPSGFRNEGGYYYYRSETAGLWSSSENGSNAWIRYLYNNRSMVRRDEHDKSRGFSVRCVKD